MFDQLQIFFNFESLNVKLPWVIVVVGAVQHPFETVFIEGHPDAHLVFEIIMLLIYWIQLSL
jgi:hypothetical protein